MAGLITGGCQCGAVRFRIERLGRASICHCRMCQKAFGAFYGPYVDAHGLEWTRGRPRLFASSNLVQRGFCGDCGTPLSFEQPDGPINIAIGALDDPSIAEPQVQIGLESKLPYADRLHQLPTRSPNEAARLAGYYAAVVSNQHPDHDAEDWRPPNPSPQPGEDRL